MAATRLNAERAAKKRAVVESYTEEDVTRALVAMVWHQGSATKARVALKAQYGLDVSVELLNGWKFRTHTERFEQLRREAQADLEQEAIRVMRDHMALAAEAEALAIEKTIAGLKSGLIERPDQAAANMAKVKATNAEKLMTMTGRPATITENRSVGQLLRVLATKGVLALPEAVDSTASEETPKELPV